MRAGLFIPNATFDLPGSAEVGGIEVYAFELGEALQRRAHEVCLFGALPLPGKTFRSTTLQLSLHRCVETKRIWKLGTRFRKLVQRLQFATASMDAVVRFRPEVMFIFKPYDFINAARWKRKLPNLRVVMNYQGKDFFPTDRYWKRFIDWEYAASDANADLAAERYGVRPEVFPNAVDIQLFSPPTILEAHDGVRVLTAGRLVGWKGLAVLLEAAAGTPGVEVWIAGDGPERTALEGLSKTLGMSSRVKFLGVLSPAELAARMREVDCFAQPSIDFDACPTAVLQALSSGLHVLMSDLVGLRSYFPDGVAASHLPARGVQAWRSALQNANAGGNREIGRAARQIIEEKFSWESAAIRLEERLKQSAG